MVPRISPFTRSLRIPFHPNPITGSAATMVLGPRQTGKSSIVRAQFPEALHLDFLDARTRAELELNPGRLQELVHSAGREVVVLDEIQKAPALLDDLHWLLENGSTRFVLCASSARKLRRAGNLLGGRIFACHLQPLTSREIPGFDLDRYLQHGGLPPMYLAEDPAALLRNYAQVYLYEEIVEEALVKRVGVFGRFLETVAATHGRTMNYSNIARECGVSHHTVRSYFQILEDTLLGFTLEPWKKSRERRMVETAKFYLFDVGVARALLPEMPLATPGTDVYGRAFEHFILREIQACYSYSHRPLRLSFWRTSSGAEVDFIVGDMRHAIETKASLNVSAQDFKGLRLVRKDFPGTPATLVYRGERDYLTEDGIRVQPWSRFLERLWAGEI
jgi:uncharacterized protein